MTKTGLFILGLGFVGGLGILTFSPASFAAQKEEIEVIEPQFVSLASNTVNLRTGPGKRYPIDWVYHKKGLPVELLARFGAWRKIKDLDGTTGWVMKGNISQRRNFRVLALTDLRRSPEADSRIMAKMEAGNIGNISSCPASSPLYCRVEIGGFSGWVLKGEIWGVYPDEDIE